MNSLLYTDECDVSTYKIALSYFGHDLQFKGIGERFGSIEWLVSHGTFPYVQTHLHYHGTYIVGGLECRPAGATIPVAYLDATIGSNAVQIASVGVLFCASVACDVGERINLTCDECRAMCLGSMCVAWEIAGSILG